MTIDDMSRHASGASRQDEDQPKDAQRAIDRATEFDPAARMPHEQAAGNASSGGQTDSSATADVTVNEETLDVALEDSFPASDPPGLSGLTDGITGIPQDAVNADGTPVTGAEPVTPHPLGGAENTDTADADANDLQDSAGLGSPRRD